MPFLSFSELSRVLPGVWLVPPVDESLGILCVSDDSRKLPKGALFVAIAGELTDGHKYLSKAVEGGVLGVVVQEKPSAEVLARMSEAGCACRQVADSLVAYQQLARWHRECYPGVKVVGVTGSCGKTSTKEMIASILEERFPGGVLKTVGSTNNHFGVPRNLFRIDDATRVAIVEMGTNHPGEIASLAALAPAQIGVVCNIGRAHLEFFHDLRGVAKEKSAILSAVTPGGVAIYPGEAEGAEILRTAAKNAARVLRFGDSSQDDLQYQYLGYEQGKFRLRLRWKDSGEERVFLWNLGGEHMAANAACAALAATAAGCTPDQVVEGLRKCVLPGERLRLVERDGVCWVNDAFNANPTSMKAALDWFAEVAPQNAPQLLVLGDMRELGAGSEESHREALSYALAKCPKAGILAVGEEMKKALSVLPDTARCRWAKDAAEAKDLLGAPAVGTWILLKSSHGVGLAALAPA